MKKILVIASALASALAVVACASKNQGSTTGTAGTSTTREDSTASAASGTGHGGAHGTAGATGSHAGTGSTQGTGSMGGATGTSAGATGTTGSTGMESGTGMMSAEGGMPMMEFSTKEEFLAHIQHVNEMEIQAGQMAQKNATNAKVKQYGTTLVTDHKKAQTKVKPMLTGAAATMSAEHKKMMEPKMAKMNEMKALKGVEFERQFLTQMVADHKETIEVMKSFKEKTDDAKVKSLITELLPTIEMHHKTAETLLASVDRQNTSGQ